MASTRSALRIAVFLIGGLETIAFAGFVLVVDPFDAADRLARSIAIAMSLLMAVPYVTLVLPALILAAWGRFLPFALSLTIAAFFAAGFLWNLA